MEHDGFVKKKSISKEQKWQQGCDIIDRLEILEVSKISSLSIMSFITAILLLFGDRDPAIMLHI